MEEAKKPKSKTVSIKNKKAAKQTLAKASIKGQKTTKKTPTKASAVKKKTKTVKIPSNIVSKDEKKVTSTTVKKSTPKTKTKVVKEPNNIKRKIETKENIEIEIPEIKSEETHRDIEKEIKEKINRINLLEKEKKRAEKQRKKEERQKKRKEKKDKKIAEKNKLKEKKLKEKKIEKEQKKKKQSKIEYPKEWKTINSKNSKVNKELVEEPKGFKGKIKSSIFESIDEKELQERKKKSKESLKKTLIIFLIIFITIGIIVYSLLKYNDYVRKQLAIYEPYRIGDKVKLKDESVWYVINDSTSSEDTIRLLATKMVDLNDDGVIDSNDLAAYNTDNKAEYDINNENSAAHLLNNVIKKKFEDSIGNVKDISLLTSKEYVKIRERMNYGDEWSNGNWLASGDYQKWWIRSEQNDKVFVVTSKGTFYLSKPNSTQFIRPTIEINKDLVTKIEEKKEITMDFINGLKRK